MASRLDVGSHQGANVLPADDDTGLMETTQHEVIQRSLCRKGWVVLLNNMLLTCCFT